MQIFLSIYKVPSLSSLDNDPLEDYETHITINYIYTWYKPWWYNISKVFAVLSGSRFSHQLALMHWTHRGNLWPPSIQGVSLWYQSVRYTIRYKVYDTKIMIHQMNYRAPSHRGPHHHQWETSMQITPSDYLDGLLIVHYYVDPLLIDISALINREPFIYLHGTPFTDRPSLHLITIV